MSKISACKDKGIIGSEISFIIVYLLETFSPLGWYWDTQKQFDVLQELKHTYTKSLYHSVDWLLWETREDMDASIQNHFQPKIYDLKQNVYRIKVKKAKSKNGGISVSDNSFSFGEQTIDFTWKKVNHPKFYPLSKKQRFFAE